jgi:hypothetical protein
MRLFPWRRALVLVGRWLNANKVGGQGPAEPFRIAGNFYYVGATDAQNIQSLQLTTVMKRAKMSRRTQRRLPNALPSARCRRTAVIEIGGDEPAAVGAAL